MAYRIEHVRAGCVQPWGKVETCDLESIRAIAPYMYRRAVGRGMGAFIWRNKHKPGEPLKVVLRDWRGRDMGVIFAVKESNHDA